MVATIALWILSVPTILWPLVRIPSTTHSLHFFYSNLNGNNEMTKINKKRHGLTHIIYKVNSSN